MGQLVVCVCADTWSDWFRLYVLMIDAYLPTYLIPPRENLNTSQ